MTHWSRDFVGLPWLRAGRSAAGVDCWGLLWLVYCDVLSIAVASYADETVDEPERAEIAEMIRGEEGRSCWLPVPFGQEREFDMLVFRRAGIESHIGIVVEPGRMLHVLQGSESRAETFIEGRWRSKLVALRRHVDLERHHAA